MGGDATAGGRKRGRAGRWGVVAAVVAVVCAIPAIAPAAALGATISGKVTSEGGGAGIEGICVTVFDETGFEEIEFAETDGEGEYTAEVPPGEYKVVFFDCNPSPSYVEEWWDDKPDGESADIVDTTGGNAVGIDAELEMGETISGQVTSDGAHGIGEICVDVVGLIDEFEVFGLGFTDEEGNYATVAPTIPGKYKVVFYDCRLEPESEYLEQWWDDKPDFGSADVVDTTDGEMDNEIDAVLEMEPEPEEPEPEDGSGSGSGSSSTPGPAPAVVPALPPGVPQGQGVARALGVAQVKGNKALLRLRCPGLSPCKGVAKLIVRVKTKPKRSKRGAKRSRRRAGKRGKRVRNVVIGRSRFSLPAGGRKTIRIRLNGRGKALLRRAGKRGLKATLAGNGVKRRAVKLKAKAPRRAKKRA